MLLGTQATGSATGTSASINTQAISATDPNSGMAINTGLSTGTATDGSVDTKVTVDGEAGSSFGDGETSGSAAGGGQSSSTSAMTSLVTPDAAVVGGFTNAQGTTTANSATATLAFNAGKVAATSTKSAATSLTGILAAAGSSGTSLVNALGGQAVGTAMAQTDTASVAAKIQALFAGEQGQALAQLVAQAITAPVATSAGVRSSGSAQGSQSASVSGGGSTNATPAL
ncbi:hypothetical protein N2152v2_008905 [Parachlorella kessleri]